MSCRALRYAPIVAMLLLGVAAIPAACAQSFQWGVTAGVAGTVWGDFEHRAFVAPQAGLLFDVAPESMYGLRSGVSWIRRGNATDVYQGYTLPIAHEKLTVDEIAVPVLLRYSAPFEQGGRPSLYFGVQFADRVRRRVDLPGGAIALPYEWARARWSTGCVFGVSIENHVGASTVGADARYWSDIQPLQTYYRSSHIHSWSIALNWWPRWRGAPDRGTPKRES